MREKEKGCAEATEKRGEKQSFIFWLSIDSNLDKENVGRGFKCAVLVDGAVWYYCCDTHSGTSATFERTGLHVVQMQGTSEAAPYRGLSLRQSRSLAVFLR